MITHPSPNFGPRREGAAIDMMVLHYTGMETAQASLTRLCDPAAQVSAHYLIDELGTVYRLVDERMRAWHAGLAYWRGDRDVNSRSIGIELQNLGHQGGLPEFPERQIDALIRLCRDLLERHPIAPVGVVAHSDVAPDRKADPGEKFPWQRLAAAGIGMFPQTPMATEKSLSDLLDEIGYDPGATDRISAFQRRFRPEHVTGQADPICAGLAAAYLSHIS